MRSILSVVAIAVVMPVAAAGGDVRTPGYYNDEARTQESIDDAGWFHTFDLAVRACLVCGVKGGRTLADAYDATCSPMFTPDDRARFEQTVLGR